MDHSTMFLYQKIIDHISVLRHRLGADSGWSWFEMIRSDFGHQTLERSNKGRFAGGSPHLSQSYSPVFSSKFSEAAIGERIAQVEQINISPAVAFARKSKDSVRPTFDTAINHPRKMHT